MHSKQSSVWVFVLLIGFTASIANARVWYVKPDGTGDAPTIQAAVDSTTPPDTVMLASGVFTGPGNKDVNFRGKAITVVSESGAASTVIDCEGSGGGFVFDSNEGPGSVLSGITVTSGMVGSALQTLPASMTRDEYIEQAPAAVLGGAVNVVAGSPTITGNVFISCTASLGGAVGVTTGSPVIENNWIESCNATYGGAVYILTTANPQIVNNTIRTCTALDGGGINCAVNGTGTIRGNTIQSCYASGQGGGIFCGDNSFPAITNNEIRENSADSQNVFGTGGGIYCGAGSHPEITGNLVASNTVGYAQFGAGIALYQSDSYLAFNTISNNSGGEYARGGGIHCLLCQDTIQNNELGGNSAYYGGGAYFSMADPGVPVVRNNVFSSNNADEGGGTYLQLGGGGERVTFTDCEYTANLAANIGGGAVGGNFDGCSFRNNAADSTGGGVSSVGSLAIKVVGYVANCVFEGNSASDGGGVWNGYAATSLHWISGCVFVSNTATVRGGAISIDRGSRVEYCTLVGNGAPDGGGIAVRSDPIIRNTIVAFGVEGVGIYCYADEWFANPYILCSDIYGNAGGDSLACGTLTDNISADPWFCDAEDGDYRLAADSPCSPSYNDCGEQIGARGVGCGPVPVMFSAVSAAARGNSVLVTWDVFVDEPIAGFNILRNSGSDRREVLVNTGGRIASTARSFSDDDVRPSTTYTYRVVAVKPDGNELSSRTTTVKTPAGRLALDQNFPNPFNPSTSIRYNLPRDTRVDLAVYDANGKLVKRLASGVQAAGPHEVPWNGRDQSGRPVSSGVYFVKLTAEKSILTRKMLLLK